MKVHIPMVIKRIGNNRLLVALPDYPRPITMSLDQFEREQKKYAL